MKIRAAIRRSYVSRLTLMALLSLLFGGWFLWDGFVTYPKERHIRETYDGFTKDGRTGDWPAFAREKGWPDGTTGHPGKDHSDGDIILQKVLGFAIVPVALLFGFGVLRSFGKWVELDDARLRTSAGDDFPVSAITRINKDRWDAKGIAILFYEDQGTEKRVVLDDWKYETQPTRDILKSLEPPPPDHSPEFSPDPTNSSEA